MLRITYYIGLHSPTGDNMPTHVVRRHHAALNILSSYYDAFNVTSTEGRWKGVGEPSLRVEVIIEENRSYQRMERAEQAQVIAREIAQTLKQDAVGLAIETLDSFQLITKD